MIKYIKKKKLDLVYIKDFFSHEISNAVYDRLIKNIDWNFDQIHIFGKKMVLKRRIAWYGDEDKIYKYSGTTKVPLKWNKTLYLIKNIIENHINYSFNSVLLNEYGSGQEGMGWHSDDEKELGPSPTIASLSLGASRDFYFRSNKDHSIVKLHLENGSLLIMQGETQHFWKHSLPKRLKLTEGRINLTFRKIN